MSVIGAEIVTAKVTNARSTGKPNPISAKIAAVPFLFTIKLLSIALSSTKSAGSTKISTNRLPLYFIYNA